MNAPQRLALRLATLLVALACFGLSGCASFYDDVTSRDFEVRSLWVKPNPLVVLRDSKDGDKRAKALRAMPEPAQFGESQEQQDAYLKILCTAAVSERTALCRQAAIATLRTYKDPRVWLGQKESKPGATDGFPGLKDAYYAAADFAGNSPETLTILRCQCLEAIGQVGNPDAVPWLVTLVKQPPASPKDAEKDQTLVLQERIAATRALGHFKHMQAAETLLTVLQKEKDPGLRFVANNSLQQETGKRFPDDAVAWDKYLHNTQDKDTIFGDPSLTDKVLDVVNVGWWWK